jgi:hypothetical protein
MNLARSLASCALVSIGFLATGCVAAEFRDIAVGSEQNPKADLDGYSTYTWAATALAVRDPDAEWSPPDFDIGAEITHLVDTELRDRGMTEVSESPDVLVMYAVGVDMKALDLVTDTDDGASHFQQVPKTGLKILVVDPQTRQLLWVGTAEGNVTEAVTVDLARRRIKYAIKHIFKRSKF